MLRKSPAPADPTALKPDSYWSKMALHRVPPVYMLVAAFVSYLILALAFLQLVSSNSIAMALHQVHTTPIWLSFGLALIPWVIIVLVEVEWSYKHFGWLALFFLLAFVQTIHYSEHCIQVIQVHFFHVPLHRAQAIFGTFNVEWVHFLGDSFLLIGTLVLLKKFPRNPWLWPSAVFAMIHQAEHSYLIINYVFLGAPAGQPGLLASPGGLIAGGVGLNRADLHWIYNTLYTIPLALALVWQLKRSYDEALDEAFPMAPKEELLKVSTRLESLHYAAAETVLSPGEDVDRLYIITEGQAGVYTHDADGREVELATLHQGQYFGEIGLLVPNAPHTKVIRAKTDLSVLAMDQATFREVMAASQATDDEMTTMARSRMALGARPVTPRPVAPMATK